MLPRFQIPHAPAAHTTEGLAGGRGEGEGEGEGVPSVAILGRCFPLSLSFPHCPSVVNTPTLLTHSSLSLVLSTYEEW